MLQRPWKAVAVKIARYMETSQKQGLIDFRFETSEGTKKPFMATHEQAMGASLSAFLTAGLHAFVMATRWNQLDRSSISSTTN